MSLICLVLARSSGRRAGIKQIGPAEAAIARDRGQALFIRHEVAVGATIGAAGAVFSAERIWIVILGQRRRRAAADRDRAKNQDENNSHASLLSSFDDMVGADQQ